MKFTTWAELPIRPLSTKEFLRLERSLRSSGQQQEILCLPDGTIIDGHHRHKILGDDVKYRVIDMDRDSAFGLAVALNVARRQMTEVQIGEIQKALKKNKKAQKETAASLRKQGYTQEEAAAVVGVAPRTVDSWEDATNFKNEDSCIQETIFSDEDTKPDYRVKLNSAAKKKIIQLADAGKTHEEIASEFGVTRQHISKIVSEEKKRREEREAAAEIANQRQKEAPKLWELVNGDFRENGPGAESVSLIFTDPPYDRESVGLYADLAKQAAECLIPGGSLLCYAGHYLVPEIIKLMSEHLRYWWIIAMVHGGASARMHSYHVYAEWKPILWFVKEGRRGTEMVKDCVKSQHQGKGDHEWQQSTTEAEYYIKHLTHEGEVVYDPMAGSGTTLIAAAATNRFGYGCEISPGHYARAIERINYATG